MTTAPTPHSAAFATDRPRPVALPVPTGAVLPAPRLPRPALLRKVDIAWLAADGTARDAARLVPALPAFEEAVAAFARGTLFCTDHGEAAVEDLWPGAQVRVAGGGTRTLLWRGATMVVPQARAQAPAMGRLTRIAADAVGMGRPNGDLVLGPWARVVRRGPDVRAMTGGDAALVAAARLEDGEGVVGIVPPAPVQVFHLGFAGHERLLAQGVEVESYHPGTAAAPGLGGDLLDQWLSCFPHKADLAAFGAPCLPRLDAREIDLFDAA